MTTPQITQGEDRTPTITLKNDGAAVNVASATAITVSLVNQAGAAALTVAASAGTAGASWATGVVAFVLTAAQTAALVPGPYTVQVKVVQVTTSIWNDSTLEVLWGAP